MQQRPIYKSVPTYRNYEDYHDAEMYVKGWNDAMHEIFDSNEEKLRKQRQKEREMRAFGMSNETIQAALDRSKTQGGNEE